MYRKWRMALKAANSSLSKVLYFSSAEDNFLLKKARGLHEPLSICCSTPPTWLSEASTDSDRIASGRGWTSAEHFVRAALAATKAASASCDQRMDLGGGEPRNKSVSGLTMRASPGIKRGKSSPCPEIAVGPLRPRELESSQLSQHFLARE